MDLATTPYAHGLLGLDSCGADRIACEPSWERKAEVAGLRSFRLYDTLMASCRLAA